MAGDEPSALFDELVDRCFEHAMGSIEGDAGPLVPFVLLFDQDEELMLTRFVAESLEVGVQRGRDALNDLPAGTQCVALVFEGLLTVEGKKRDAIIVEVYEPGRGMRLAMTFKPGKSPKPTSDVGVLDDLPPIM